jgi:hypothetical protein
MMVWTPLAFRTGSHSGWPNDDTGHLKYESGEESNVQVTRLGIDLAKTLFPPGGDGYLDKVVWRKALTRRVLEFLTQLQACMIGVEACATAHHRGREIQKLGHLVKLIHP